VEYQATAMQTLLEGQRPRVLVVPTMAHAWGSRYVASLCAAVAALHANGRQTVLLAAAVVAHDCSCSASAVPRRADPVVCRWRHRCGRDRRHRLRVAWSYLV
jgi:hypothetical protein